MIKIKLPDLPEPSYGYYAVPMYSPEAVRQIQMDTACVVLEAAAKVATDYSPYEREGPEVAAFEISLIIRALEISHD